MSRHPKLTQDKKVLLYKQGFDCFNRGDFYNAHEAWEEIWLAETGEEKLFYQGLIQVAAGCHHLQKNKFKPAITCLKKGVEKLSGFSTDNTGYLPKHDLSHQK